MSDTPIIMSGPMVRAILDGRKTQTRRVLRDQPGELDNVFKMDDGTWHHTASDGTNMSPVSVRYAPGDLLWVRESHKQLPCDPDFYPKVMYADHEDCDIANSDLGWKSVSSIYMPRWASRLTLEVTDVRVERVQDISGVDAVAEGVRSRLPDNGVAQSEFQNIWDSINAKRGFGWDHNPWVVAITFEPHRQNIDELKPLTPKEQESET